MIFYHTLFSFMDKSHKPPLREWFISSWNQPDISPVKLCADSIKVCVKHARKFVRVLRVLKLDTIWKKSREWTSLVKRGCLCTTNKIMLFAVFLNENWICVTLVFYWVRHSCRCPTMFLIKLPYIYSIADSVTFYERSWKVEQRKEGKRHSYSLSLTPEP